MNAWSKFWNWYENKILGSIILIARSEERR